MRALLSHYSAQPERGSFPTKSKNHFFGFFLLYLSTSFSQQPIQPTYYYLFFFLFPNLCLTLYIYLSSFSPFLSLSVSFHTHTYTSNLSPSFILIYSLSFPISLYLFFFLLFLSLVFYCLYFSRQQESIAIFSLRNS